MKKPKKLFKKGLVTALVLCMALPMAACGSSNSKSASSLAGQADARNLKLLKKALQGIDDVVANIDSYDGEEMDELKELFDTLYEGAQGLQDKVSDLEFSSDEDVEKVSERGLEILSELCEVSDSMVTMMDSMIEIQQAAEPLSVVNLETATTYDDIEYIYNAVSQVVEDIEAIDAPQYATFVLDRLTTTYEEYQTLAANYYSAYQNEDPLMQASSKAMYERVTKEISDATDEYVDVYTAEINQFADICDSIVNVEQPEVIEAIDNILNGKNKKISFTENADFKVGVYTTDVIYPGAYSSMPYVMKYDAVCNQGERDVIVKMEIPGFTQPYEQKITIGREVTRGYIKPAVLTDADLSKQQDLQINFSIVDADTDDVLSQETKNVKVMSKNDFVLASDTEYSYLTYESLLAWLTPETQAIRDLSSKAAQELSELTNGQLNSIIGTQGDTDLETGLQYTAYQAFAYMRAMSDMGVNYVMGSFSLGENSTATQRIYYPTETINDKSGVCVDLSLAIASALQSAGFHTMIILPPGHCQVAVEIMPDSGEYILIECTVVPNTADDINNILTYYTKDQWAQYISDAYVLDCNMATAFNILPVQQ